jgi:putative membrane protein
MAATGDGQDPDGAGGGTGAEGAGVAQDAEPDARFTFANERTFLALTRTALAFVVAGLAIVQLLPPFPEVPWGRRLLGIPLIVVGGIIAVAGYIQWSRNQQALRHGGAMPESILPRVLSVTIAAMAIVAAVILLVSALLEG